MDTEEIEGRLTKKLQSRRDMLRALGGGAMAAVAAGMASSAPAYAGAGRVGGSGDRSGADLVLPLYFLDIEILNFALNLEYLDSEYYTYATTGQGIEAQGVGITGVGQLGPTLGGARVNFEDPQLEVIANQIAADERAQVNFIRQTILRLGGRPIAKPTIDLTAARARGIDPTTQEGFLVATRDFEDTGVSAYGGTARFLTNRDVIQNTSRIQSVEAYHSGNVRLQIAQRGIPAPPLDEVDVPPPPTGTNFFQVDENGLAIIRMPRQVLNIVYLATPENPNPRAGGFFPRGVNGNVGLILLLR